MGQVMPLPSGLDYGVNISSEPNSPQVGKEKRNSKKDRNSIKTSRDSVTPPPAKDHNTLLHHNHEGMKVE